MSDPVVRVRGLTKRFGPLVAVDGLELTVSRGAVFGLLGPNGAGKSTTFNVLCGWMRADAGDAVVLGVASRFVHRLRGRLAALPQDAAFPPQVRVVEQLAHYGILMGMARARARDEALRALDLVGMRAAAGRQAGELSQGMRKRMGLAQALLGDPELVLLDEPTAGLDPVAARQVKDLIVRLGRHATVVLASHNLAEVQEICSHGAILDRGRLVAAGTLAELTRRGTEVTIELGEGATVPLATLERSAGVEGVSVPAPQLVQLVIAPDAEVAVVIGRALRILLDAAVPILGVRRGTSLERAFLEATGAASTPPDESGPVRAQIAKEAACRPSSTG